MGASQQGRDIDGRPGPVSTPPVPAYAGGEEVRGEVGGNRAVAGDLRGMLRGVDQRLDQHYGRASAQISYCQNCGCFHLAGGRRPADEGKRAQ